MFLISLPAPKGLTLPPLALPGGTCLQQGALNLVSLGLLLFPLCPSPSPLPSCPLLSLPPLPLLLSRLPPGVIITSWPQECLCSLALFQPQPGLLPRQGGKVSGVALGHWSVAVGDGKGTCALQSLLCHVLCSRPNPSPRPSLALSPLGC